MAAPHRRTRLFGALIAAAAASGAAPSGAAAHGPVAPVASSYLARVRTAPAGLRARVVDGDQRMWLRVPPDQTVVVLDYRGAPYLRFTRRGVAVNRNSSMYYLNQAPVALGPPPSLTVSTPPHWRRVSGGDAYNWHDGRLHALATVALAPGQRFVGTWRVPLIVDGRASAITGGLWHADDPSIVWFWPIAVLLLCVLAAWRLRDPRLDQRVSRVLAIAGLLATATAGVGHELHGRPDVTVLQLITLALIGAFVAWGLISVTVRPQGYFKYLLVALAALWQGGILIPVLLKGYVLMAEPAFLARAATVLCLGAGASLVLLVFRLPGASGEDAAEGPFEEREDAWELA